ncbi:sporulation histidine kinase inhibitor Sda [Brevibacillus sp. B_LB10_24]|uniref:sporulation histidine kinase inhibitor Sda n=1 Tax=Brevibacillus TaxID=55080 RepID=UPI0003792499|nr:sporulation histidine kinase inhibitor Sda [Brevibacillus massiliensis]
MKYLSDALLLEVYQRAKELQLEQAFIELLYSEMQDRNLVQFEASTQDQATRTA